MHGLDLRLHRDARRGEQLQLPQREGSRVLRGRDLRRGPRQGPHGWSGPVRPDPRQGPRAGDHCAVHQHRARRVRQPIRLADGGRRRWPLQHLRGRRLLDVSRSQVSVGPSVRWTRPQVAVRRPASLPARQRAHESRGRQPRQPVRVRLRQGRLPEPVHRLHRPRHLPRGAGEPDAVPPRGRAHGSGGGAEPGGGGGAKEDRRQQVPTGGAGGGRRLLPHAHDGLPQAKRRHQGQPAERRAPR
mmetsp:Transcript_2178/g.6129  ORF Transcript_2178/g.6129 Transcript_2178/m.6129 type:complete len:243 (+) Transcript_2178:541-1269(+)